MKNISSFLGAIQLFIWSNKHLEMVFPFKITRASLPKEMKCGTISSLQL